MRNPNRLPGGPTIDLSDKVNISDSVSKTGELSIYGGVSGEKALKIYDGTTEVFSVDIPNTVINSSYDISLTSGGKIVTTANGDLTLLPNGTGITIVGDAGSTSHSLAANDDLFVSGKLEVDGRLYIDGQMDLNSSCFVKDDINLTFGDGGDVILRWSTAQASAHALLACLDDAGKMLLFSTYANRLKNHDHAAQSNPTIFLHSATDPDTDNAEWLSLTHNTTDAVITSGQGKLKLVTTDGPIQLLPAAGQISQVGDGGSTSHSLAANDDLFISGKLEADGQCYFDANVNLASNLYMLNGTHLVFDTDQDVSLNYDTGQTANCLVLWLDPDALQLVVGSGTYTGTGDYGHGAATNPTIFVHSAADPSGNTTAYTYMSHNDTNGDIGCAKGDLLIQTPAGTVDFVDATLGATTVTHDDYVELKVGGVTKKFMLGS